MSILLYANPLNRAGNRLRQAIATQVEPQEIELHRSVESLVDRLHQPLTDVSILVLSAHSRKTLQNLAAARSLWNDIPVILVLPDTYKRCVQAGRKLYPRFVSFIDSDFSDVVLVVEKIIQTHRLKHIEPWC